MNIDDEEREARFEAILRENESLRKKILETELQKEIYLTKWTENQALISVLEGAIRSDRQFELHHYQILSHTRRDLTRRASVMRLVGLVIGMAIGLSIGFFIGVAWE